MRRHEEDDIQLAVCQHLRMRGTPGMVWFAVPNGGRRNAREGARMKACGVRAGVADLLFLNRGNFYALELKTKTGRTTETQEQFLLDWEAAGGFGFVAQGLDEAITILETAGLLKGKTQ